MIDTIIITHQHTRRNVIYDYTVEICVQAQQPICKFPVPYIINEN